MLKEIDLESAQQRLLDHGKALENEHVPILEAEGRILSEDVISPIDLPPFSKSPLDGFALRAIDTVGAEAAKPIFLDIIDIIRAGDTRRNIALREKTGVQILTGAPLPAGADVVVRKEHVSYEQGKIYLTREETGDTNIIHKGSEIKLGERVFLKGEEITPYHIGICAAMGIEKVTVHKRPYIGIISTGDELVNPGTKLKFGQIHDSNKYTILAVINKLGACGVDYGCVSDNEREIEKRIKQALEKCDMVITTGGVSVGETDLLPSTLTLMGAEILFNRIMIKPGTPSTAGVFEGKPVICLSGNPAAAAIGFELLVTMLIRKMKGEHDYRLKHIRTILVEGFDNVSSQRRFLRVNVTNINGVWYAKQTGNQKPNVLRSMLGCNALVEIPDNSEPLPPGIEVNAVLLR